MGLPRLSVGVEGGGLDAVGVEGIGGGLDATCGCGAVHLLRVVCSSAAPPTKEGVDVGRELSIVAAID